MRARRRRNGLPNRADEVQAVARGLFPLPFINHGANSDGDNHLGLLGNGLPPLIPSQQTPPVDSSQTADLPLVTPSDVPLNSPLSIGSPDPDIGLTVTPAAISSLVTPAAISTSPTPVFIPVSEELSIGISIQLQTTEDYGQQEGLATTYAPAAAAVTVAYTPTTIAVETPTSAAYDSSQPPTTTPVFELPPPPDSSPSTQKPQKNDGMSKGTVNLLVAAGSLAAAIIFVLIVYAFVKKRRDNLTFWDLFRSPSKRRKSRPETFGPEAFFEPGTTMRPFAYEGLGKSLPATPNPALLARKSTSSSDRPLISRGELRLDTNIPPVPPAVTSANRTFYDPITPPQRQASGRSVLAQGPSPASPSPSDTILPLHQAPATLTSPIDPNRGPPPTFRQFLANRRVSIAPKISRFSWTTSAPPQTPRGDRDRRSTSVYVTPGQAVTTNTTTPFPNYPMRASAAVPRPALSGAPPSALNLTRNTTHQPTSSTSSSVPDPSTNPPNPHRTSLANRFSTATTTRSSVPRFRSIDSWVGQQAGRLNIMGDDSDLASVSNRHSTLTTSSVSVTDRPAPRARGHSMFPVPDVPREYQREPAAPAGLRIRELLRGKEREVGNGTTSTEEESEDEGGRRYGVKRQSDATVFRQHPGTEVVLPRASLVPSEVLNMKVRPAAL